MSVDYAEQWRADLLIAEMGQDRTAQAHQRILGVSDIGHCRAYAARFLNGDPFTDSGTHKAASLGTMVHAAVLPVIAEARGALHEVEMTVTLSNGMEVLGHADLVEDPDVTDLKTTRGLAHVRRHGANLQQKVQRHLYGAGARQNGLVTQPGGMVRNLWMDVDDLDALPHVEEEPYDPTYLDTAATWVDEVMYAVDQGRVEDAPRDKDVFWCREFCPFVSVCRGPEQLAVDETIDSDELAVAAALRREALEMEREAKQLRAASDEVLARVEDTKVIVRGEAGTFRIASTWTAPTDVAYTRRGYYRLDVKEIEG